jgi:parvulin-like peptidyl-prolyl isomerase
VGGDLGFFHEGQTVPEFEDALNKMKAGEISEPIKSRYGWHIIKLVELNEMRQLEFEETKDKIRKKLEKIAKDRLVNSWMSELKGKYPVKNFNQ